MPEKLVLYHFPSCPFCQYVTRYLDKRNIKIPMKDILENKTYKEELIRMGGKSQVPCLVIDGKALYESRDIVKWFEKNYK